MKKVVQYILVFFFVIALLSQWLGVEESNGENGDDDATLQCTDSEVLDSTATIGWTKFVNRAWRDNYSNDAYCIDYLTLADDANQSTDYRFGMRAPRARSDNDYWGQVYASFFQQDRDRLIFLEDSVRTIIQSQNLDDLETIHYLVSMVQDIPYQYIMPESCEGFSDHPCVPNQRFGILTPVEFLFYLTGDCDTRTVLLYTLLTNFGYQPIIVNSVEYGHSMLAMNVPTSGDFIEHRGQRFYFWETTATGWAPGMLPPDMNNTQYWQVVLDYQN